MLARVAGRAARLVAAAGGGRGSVLPGAAALWVAPGLVEELMQDRPACLVSGTNGKTTTTALVAAALGPATVTNREGANLPRGWASALLDAPRHAPAVLEVDEAYLPIALASAPDAVVVLLNLSRDQLDRHSETRMIATRWRDALASTPRAHVVANVDDPLVVFAARAARRVIWVEGGEQWQDDARTCPACGSLIDRLGRDWWCRCGVRRPTPDVSQIEPGHLIATSKGVQRALVTLPGRANRANVAMAAGASLAFDLDVAAALESMAQVTTVSGRYGRHRYRGRDLVVLLAKNPAGWIETMDVIDEILGDGPGTIVIAINARGPDGRDPSWLWDVPFERLAGRAVIATGERATDLAVRLDHADIEYRKDTRPPLVAAGNAPRSPVIVAATYTNFLTVSRALTEHG